MAVERVVEDRPRLSVVIVDGPDFTADLTAQMNGAVRQHFIDHVGLCSRTRLKGDEESVDRGSSNDFIPRSNATTFASMTLMLAWY
jgi:hypothetical protein